VRQGTGTADRDAADRREQATGDQAPVVRATGGLEDTVVDVAEATLADKTANGFVFAEATAHALWLALERATRCWRDRKLWRRIQQNGMRRDFAWAHAVRDYVALYRDAVAAHG
jgi:starch synthase